MKHEWRTPARETRMERMFALAIVGVLLGVTVAFVRSSLNNQKRVSDIVRQHSIAKHLIFYAKEHQGNLPVQDEAGATFTTSTEAFQFLMESSEAFRDDYFYRAGNPAKRTRPVNDGSLNPSENGVIYVTGLNLSMPPDSPLIADEMESPGVYGAHHPRLKKGQAIVAYLDGHVKAERLNRKEPGATVPGPVGSGMKDIFQERPAGLLPVPRENILLP